MGYGFLSGISVAVALGTVFGGGVLAKPTLANNNVQPNVNLRNVHYGENTVNKDISNNKNITITAYEYTAKNPYKVDLDDSGSFTHYSLKTGKVIKPSEKIEPITTVSIKNYTGTTPSVYTLNLKRVTIEIPVGTKVNLLQWDGYYSVVEYKGHEYRLLSAYLNLGEVNSNYFSSNKYNLSTKIVEKENNDMEDMAKIITKDKNDNIKTIGIAVTKDFSYSENDKDNQKAVRNHNITIDPTINTLFNGENYSFKIPKGCKVNLVDVNGVSGFTMHIPHDSNQQYVEYNGIVGYINSGNLTTIERK